MIDLDLIETLAKAATPGPWKAETWCSDWEDNRWAAIGPVHSQNDNEDELNPDSSAGQAAEADSFFIAHMHPARALELVEEIRRLRAIEFVASEEYGRGHRTGMADAEDELQRTRELLEESEKLIKAQDRILAAYRLGGNPGNAPQVAMEARAKLAKLRSVSPQGAPAGGGEG